MPPIQTYVCVDLETSGFYPKYDKIIEIGAVRVENGTVTGTFQSLVSPGLQLSEQTTQVTGIADEMLRDAPDIREVLPRFLEFAGEHILLGHSILSDYSFLKKAAVNQNLSFERSGVDTLLIARKFLSELPSRNLGKLCEHFAIPHTAHRALGDAQATVRLYELLCEKFWREDGQLSKEGGAGQQEKGVTIEAGQKDGTEERKIFSPRPLIYKIKKEGPASKAQKERLYSLAALHKIELREDIDRLTRNEASRLTDKILAQYGRG